jgi:hypothetical protein
MTLIQTLTDELEHRVLASSPTNSEVDATRILTLPKTDDEVRQLIRQARTAIQRAGFIFPRVPQTNQPPDYQMADVDANTAIEASGGEPHHSTTSTSGSHQPPYPSNVSTGEDMSS